MNKGMMLKSRHQILWRTLLSILLLIFHVLISSASALEILVIGGGISGLAAARHLVQHQMNRNNGDGDIDTVVNVTLLEAKDRLGGRLHTKWMNETPIDLGGMFWHGVNSDLFRSMDESSFDTIPTFGNSVNPGKGGSKWLLEETILSADSQSTGRPTSQWNELAEEAFHRIPELVRSWNATISEHIQRLSTMGNNVDDPTKHPRLLSEWSSEVLQKLSQQDEQLLRYQLRMIFDLDFGLPLESMAISGFASGWDWKDAMGDDHIARDGMSSLIQAMTKQVGHDRIQLGQRVETIQYYSNDSLVKQATAACRVTTEHGQIWEGDACIVTIPAGVLKTSHWDMFYPPFSAERQDALYRLQLGSLNTLAVQWNRPVCMNPNITAYYLVPRSSKLSSAGNPLAHGFVCTGLLRQTFDPTITQFHYFSSRQPPMMVRRTHGDENDASQANFWKQQATNVVRIVLEHQQQSHVCNDNTNNSVPTLSEEDIVDLLWSSWDDDGDILGSYSAPSTRTRGNTDRQLLAAPIHRALYFAGEHTHTNGRYQSIDGALETGIRAAQEVIVDHLGAVCEQTMP